MEKCKKCGHEASDHEGEFEDVKGECNVSGCDCEKFISEDPSDPEEKTGGDEGGSGLDLLGGIIGEAISGGINFGGFGGGQSGGGGSNGSW